MGTFCGSAENLLLLRCFVSSCSSMEEAELGRCPPVCSPLSVWSVFMASAPGGTRHVLLLWRFKHLNHLLTARRRGRNPSWRLSSNICSLSLCAPIGSETGEDVGVSSDQSLRRGWGCLRAGCHGGSARFPSMCWKWMSAYFLVSGRSRRRSDSSIFHHRFLSVSLKGFLLLLFLLSRDNHG